MSWNNDVFGGHRGDKWVVSVSKSEESQENVYVIHVYFMLILSHENGVVTDFLLSVLKHFGVSLIPVVAASHWVIMGSIIAVLWGGSHGSDLVNVDSVHL